MTNEYETTNLLMHCGWKQWVFVWSMCLSVVVDRLHVGLFYVLFGKKTSR